MVEVVQGLLREVNALKSENQKIKSDNQNLKNEVFLFFQWCNGYDFVFNLFPYNRFSRNFILAKIYLREILSQQGITISLFLLVTPEQPRVTN